MNRVNFAVYVLIGVGVAHAALADTTAPVTHDGNWMRTNIKLYEAVRDLHSDVKLTFVDGTNAAFFSGYVGGVLSSLKAIVFKARVQQVVIDEGRKHHVKDFGFAEMEKSSNYFAPLWRTSFDTGETVSMGQYVAMIRNYLDKHPESWGEAGAGLIEKSILDVYPAKTGI